MEDLDGNVALTTVLIFSALLIVSGIAILLQAIEFAFASNSYSRQIYAENLAVSCLEEAIYRQSSSNGIYPDVITINYSEDKQCSAEFSGVSKANVGISIESEYRDARYATSSNWNFDEGTPIRLND